jgi:hypothetical protein
VATPIPDETLFKFRNKAQLAAQLAASISHVALIGPNEGLAEKERVVEEAEPY